MQRKTKVVNCRVPSALADACAAHGAAAGESVAWGVRDLLRRGLATVNPVAQPDPAGPTRRGAPGPALLRERFAATTAKADETGHTIVRASRKNGRTVYPKAKRARGK